ncbi:MAG TPA: ClbS/DfsB family four-helix bundle protein [Anaerolineales bacterium]|nr:ClbS/DfsB family four-helix bundle protein [Anaerolineales bacterium]
MYTKPQIRKEELLAKLQETRASILTEVSALPAENQNMVFLGIWSVKDVLAHLAGWDYTNVEAARYVMAGKLPPFYAHHDRDWAKYNAMLVAKYRRENLEELIELVKDSQRQLIEFIKTVPLSAFDKDFGVRFRGYKVTIRRLLEAELEDERVHQQQIADFLKERK